MKHIKAYLLLIIAMLLAWVLWLLLTDRPVLEDPRGQSATEVAKDAGAAAAARITEDDPRWDCEAMGNKICGPAVASYTGDRLPGASLCLIDETHGFPVAQAAAEFTGLVDVSVGDCSDAENLAVVRTVVRPEGSWSGWYNQPSPDRDGAALISLNLAEAFRVSPTMWRMIIVHEVGHAVGLGHTYEGDSVMHPLTGAATHTTLTTQDRVQLKKLYGA